MSFVRVMQFTPFSWQDMQSLILIAFLLQNVPLIQQVVVLYVPAISASLFSSRQVPFLPPGFELIGLGRVFQTVVLNFAPPS